MNICGFPLTMNGQTFKNKFQNRPQGPVRLQQHFLSWDTELSCTEITCQYLQRVFHLRSCLCFSECSFFPFSSPMSPYLLHSSTHLLSFPNALYPISQSEICSSCNRLHWWKRKGPRQSPHLRQGPPECGEWRLGTACGTQNVHCSGGS